MKNTIQLPRKISYISLITLIALKISLMSVTYAQPSKQKVDHADLSTLTSQFINVGQATFNVLFWDIYHSRLATDNGQFDDNSHYLFEITYLRDINSDELIKRTVEQWQHIGLEQSQYQPYLPKLESLWPDIKKGDQLALLVNHQHAHFYYNQVYLGEAPDKHFAAHFVAIWLSEKTSQPQLRSKLLGTSDNE